MSNVIKLKPREKPLEGPRPADVYGCPACDWDYFIVWADGAILCGRCAEEMPNVKALPK